MTVDLPDEKATESFGRRLAAHLRPGDLVLLEGDLGAGKTTLVRAVARALGVPEDVPVTSPTFALVHELPGEHPVVHADLYRLQQEEELLELGLLDTIASGEAIMCVEWGERFSRALGTPTLIVRLSLTGGDTRRARLEGGSVRAEKLWRALAEEGG